MISIDLFDVNVNVSVRDEENQVMGLGAHVFDQIQIEYVEHSHRFGILGIDDLELVFADDDFLSFRKKEDGYLTRVILDRSDIAKFALGLLEFLEANY